MGKDWTTEEVIELANNSGSQVFGGVDIVRVACDLGIEVITTSDCDTAFNASITYCSKDDSFQILVNDNHSRNRMRFSIAHEIAHYILHRDQIVKQGTMTRSNYENSETEEEADNLAGKLLMPDHLLNEFLFRNNIDKESEISKDLLGLISNYFRVSYIVAAIRLRHVGYKVPYISFSYMA